MKIREYLESQRRLDRLFTNAEGATFEQMAMESKSIWDNDACRGYAILAMQQVGLNDETIADVVHALRDAFSICTEEEAEKCYLDSKFY